MTQVLIDCATLKQLVGALEKHHNQETRYSDNKRRANATCAHFTANPLQELAEQAYMLTHGKETIEAITAGRAALANTELVEPDTQRLDFMFLYDAFLSRTKTDADNIAYQLLAQDEDEDYVVLSGEDKFFPTGRAAVDAAREKAKP